jgi:hypothetical protein
VLDVGGAGGAVEKLPRLGQPAVLERRLGLSDQQRSQRQVQPEGVVQLAGCG